MDAPSAPLADATRDQSRAVDGTNVAVIQNDSRGRNRHFDIRLQFVRYNIDASQFLISYCPSDDNLADGGTKALNRLKQEISSRRILNLPSAARSDG